MVHKFSMHGTYFALDVGSGAVHMLDEVAYRLLDYMDGGMPDYTQLGFPKEQIDEAWAELRQLQADGLLFSAEDYQDVSANFRKNVPVKAMCLHVCHDCNLRCGYCFAGQGDYSGERQMMSTAIGEAAIDFVIKQSGGRRNIEIDFFGGEPLMNFDVVKHIVEYAREKERHFGKMFRFTMTTNGLLLDNEKLEYINKNMYNLVISLDGRRHVNDTMRKTVSGEGSYDAILPKLLSAADSRGQMNYYVRGTFTRLNLDFASDVMHLAGLGFKQLSVEPVVAPQDREYAIRAQDLPIIFEEYEKLALQYIDSDFNFFHFMLDLDDGPCVIKRIAGCGAGCEYIAVTPSGDIFPCHQFVGQAQFKMGNVNEDNFDQDMARGFSGNNVYTKEECAGCWAKFFCSGGCHANAYFFSGDINIPYKIGCEMQRKRIECALYVYAKKQIVE